MPRVLTQVGWWVSDSIWASEGRLPYPQTVRGVSPSHSLTRRAFSHPVQASPSMAPVRTPSVSTSSVARIPSGSRCLSASRRRTQQATPPLATRMARPARRWSAYSHNISSRHRSPGKARSAALSRSASVRPATMPRSNAERNASALDSLPAVAAALPARMQPSARCRKPVRACSTGIRLPDRIRVLSKSKMATPAG